MLASMWLCAHALMVVSVPVAGIPDAQGRRGAVFPTPPPVGDLPQHHCCVARLSSSLTSLIGGNPVLVTDSTDWWEPCCGTLSSSLTPLIGGNPVVEICPRH